MIGFNLSTYKYTNRKISYLLQIVVCVVIILFSSYNYRSHLLLSESLQQSDTDVSRLKNEITLLKKDVYSSAEGKDVISASKKIEGLKKSIEGINAILGKKGFSWSELFYSLEKASPRNVSIMGIKPSYSNKRIKISGQAKSLSQVTALVDNLQDTTYIKKSILLQESARLLDNRHPVIVFDIESEVNF
ncbi:MAG: PilN domain-containing protein [Proteobacteria bacterium]|nr:PilN domain-containing protein [Pseudomonadota bacterium]